LQETACLWSVFWRFGIPVFANLCDSVAGHRRGGTLWRSRGTIVRRICYGRRWRRSSTSVIRWCGWRARSIGGFSTAGLPACVRQVRASRRCLTRLVAGLFILKHMHDLSDEVLCARWVENPYYQFFCGELSFCHQLPFDRSSLTHWRPAGRRAVGGFAPGELVGGAPTP